MLQFLRKSVYDGSIPKPQPTPIPKLKPRQRTDLHQNRSFQRPLYPIPTQIQPAEPKNETDSNIPSSSPHNPQSDVPNSAPRTLRLESTHILWPIPIPSYSHSRACMLSPKVHFTTVTTTAQEQPTVKLLLTQSPILKYDTAHKALMTELEAESLQRWESGDWNEDLERTSEAMKLELTASRVAKGVFFRRCNGMYVNALGWVWREDFADGHDDERASDMSDEPFKDRDLRKLQPCRPSMQRCTEPAGHDRVVMCYARLHQREALVRTSSLHSDEDLVLTCWAWNRQLRRELQTQGSSKDAAHNQVAEVECLSRG